LMTDAKLREAAREDFEKHTRHPVRFRRSGRSGRPLGA
jgi:hypothetical protein